MGTAAGPEALALADELVADNVGDGGLVLLEPFTADDDFRAFFA